MVIEFTCHQYGKRFLVREESLGRQQVSDPCRRLLRVLGPKRLISHVMDGVANSFCRIDRVAPNDYEDADDTDAYSVEHERLNWWITALRQELESGT